jgi:hypothetical protein
MKFVQIINQVMRKREMRSTVRAHIDENENGVDVLLESI